MPEPLIFPKKFDVPDGSQFNPGFLDSPVEATVRTAEGIVEGGLKLGYDTFALGVDIGASPYGISGEKDVIGADNFWQVYNSSNKYLEYGDPQRTSGLRKGFANVTPFVLSARAAATKLTDWGKAFSLIKNTESFKSMLAINGAAGIYADMVHTRKEESSLFALIPEENRPEFAQWFMDKTDDSEFEGRFKHAIEGAALGIGIDSGFRVAGGLIDQVKRVFHKTDVPITEQLQQAERILDGSGSFTDAYMDDSSLKGAMRENGDPVEQFFKDSNSTPADELAGAQKRLKRSRRYSNKKRKKRLEKKITKQEGELAEWDDTVYKSDTYKNAASERIDTGNYTPRQIYDEQSLRDVFRQNIDEKVATEIKDLVDLVDDANKGANDVATKILHDSTSTPERKEIAKKFLGQDEESLLRLNANTSGDRAIEGAVRLVAAITGDSKLPKRGPRAFDEVIFDSYANIVSGQTGKELSASGLAVAKFAKEMNYDFDSIARTLSAVNAMGKNMEEVITAARSVRHDAVTELSNITKEIAASKEPNMELMAKYMRMAKRVDTIDSSLQGTIGSTGRILNMQHADPSEFAKGNLEWTYQTAIDRNISKEALKEADTATGKLMRNLDEKVSLGDWDKWKKEVLDAEDVWTDAKAARKLVNNPKFMDLMESYVYSSYLSGIGTLSSSVIMGNTVSTFLKSNLVPHFEAVIGTLSRAVGVGADSGVSILDGFRANYITLKMLARSVQNMFAGGDRKVLDDLFHLSSTSTREGAEKAAQHLPEIQKEYAKLAKYYADNDMYVKKTLVELAQPLMSRSTAVGNIMVRRIMDADKFFRGLNNEVHLALEAERAWGREGGKAIFGGMIPKKTFVKRFSHYQREYARIAKDSSLGKNAKDEAFKSLFEDNRELYKAVKKSVDHAEKIGKQATFQQDPEGLLSEVVDNIRRKADNHAGGKLAQMAIFPFTRTPMNMLDEVITHSPLSVTTGRFWKTLKHGTDMEKIEVVAKMASGTAIMVSVGNLFAADRIQGSINPNDREAYRAAGIKEHSIKIGDTWYSYEKLGPVGVMLSTASDYWNYRYQDPNASLTLLLSQSLSLASDQSLYKTLREVLDLAQLEGPQGEDKGEKFVLNRASRLIQPVAGMTESTAAFFQAVIKGKQTRYRTIQEEEIATLYDKHRNILAEALKGNTAYRMGLEAVGLAEYEEDLDVLGGPAVKHGEGLNKRFLHLIGVTNVDQSSSPGVLELFKHGVISQNASGHSVKGLNGSVKISRNQWKDLQRELFHGEINMRGELDRLVKTPFYRSLAVGQQETLLKQTLRHNQEFLKARLYNKDQKLQHKDYINGLMKVWRDNKVLDEPRNEAERYDNLVKQRALLKENNKAVLKDFEAILGVKPTTNPQNPVSAAREALKPLLGDDNE